MGIENEISQLISITSPALIRVEQDRKIDAIARLAGSLVRVPEIKSTEEAIEVAFGMYSKIEKKVRRT